MAILAAYVVPHPPLAQPQVGAGRESAISATLDAYRQIAAETCALFPDTLVISSPHAPLYRDYLQISSGPRAKGSFAQFGVPRPVYEVDYDQEFVVALESAAREEDLAAGTQGRQSGELDHGVLVPLHFLKEAWESATTKRAFPKVVRLGLSGLSPLEHYRLGTLVQKVAATLGRRVVYIASGDCSHKLLPEGPYGFNPSGPEFDHTLETWLSQGDFLGLLCCDPDLAERAAECGLRSFQIMSGAFDRTDVATRVLSHEGPFGVGYLVARIEPVGEEGTFPNRAFGAAFPKAQALADAKAREKEGLLCALARASIDAFVRKGRRVRPDIVLSDLMRDKGGDAEEADRFATLLAKPAACFVSLKKHGELRGCIGTLAPTRPTLADEICENAISAATADPRFSRVRSDELAELVLDVDVLSDPEPVDSIDDLDPSHYGVIVSTDDGRRGVLLPDLAGVDTVDEQIAIASRKAGIYAGEPIRLQRFTVERHL